MFTCTRLYASIGPQTSHSTLYAHDAMREKAPFDRGGDRCVRRSGAACLRRRCRPDAAGHALMLQAPAAFNRHPVATSAPAGRRLRAHCCACRLWCSAASAIRTSCSSAAPDRRARRRRDMAHTCALAPPPRAGVPKSARRHSTSDSRYPPRRLRRRLECATPFSRLRKGG